MIFSIIVLSYNRPKQISRILEKLATTSSNDFNLIIKDDCSPKQQEIERVIHSYKNKVSFEIVLHKNKNNLGYDRNLLDAFNITTSDYVFLLSDDDFVDGTYIEELVTLLSKKEYNFYFTPYHHIGGLNRVYIKPYNIKNFHEIIYNSILFSGLIFNREYVLSLPKDNEFLSNCIYTQVFLSSLIIFKERKFGISPIKILYLGGDGENFFGKNQSAVNKDLLQDRSSITSNLKYQKLLINVVEKISTVTAPSVLGCFRSEYNKRLVSYLLRARAAGIDNFNIVVNHIYDSKLNVSWQVKLCMNTLYFVPEKISLIINKLAIRILKKSG